MSLNEHAEEAAPDDVPAVRPVRYRGTPTTPRAARRIQSLLGWRSRHNLTQREASKILGLTHPTYARFEAGKRFPRPSVAKRMQIITGLSLETILGLE
jgi:DNA-binding XRE family transcriptional regulator